MCDIVATAWHRIEEILKVWNHDMGDPQDTAHAGDRAHTADVPDPGDILEDFDAQPGPLKKPRVELEQRPFI